MLSDQPIFGVLVEDHASEQTPHVEDGESISDLQWFSIDALKAHVVRGMIRCGVTLAALSYVFAAEGTLQCFIGEREKCWSSLTGLHPKLTTLPEFMESVHAQMWEAGVEWTGMRLDSVSYFAGSESEFKALAKTLDSTASRLRNNQRTMREGQVGTTWDLGDRQVELLGVKVVRILVNTVETACATSGFYGVFLVSEESASVLKNRYPRVSWERSSVSDVARFSLKNASVTVYCGATM
jgi:hypothetical protein